MLVNYVLRIFRPKKVRSLIFLIFRKCQPWIVLNMFLSFCQISCFSFVFQAVARKCFVKKAFLEILQNSQENTCARVSFLIKLQAEACNFIKKETLTQVFSSDFCEISKNTFSYRTPLVPASVFELLL